MKTKNLQKFLIALLGVMLSVSMTNCNMDNEDENDLDSTTTKSTTKQFVRAYYCVKLGKAWYDYFDIEVIYTDVTGTEAIINPTQGCLYDETVVSTLATNEYNFKVVAKPKANIPEIEDAATYDISKDCSMYIYKYNEGDSVVKPKHQISLSTSATIDGATLREEVGKERTILADSYTL